MKTISRLNQLAVAIGGHLQQFEERPLKGVNYREDTEVKGIEPTGLEAVLKNYEFGDRARDSGGRYAPGNDVSPEDMADAYVKPKKRRSALLAGAGAAGVAAAVAGKKTMPGITAGAGRLIRGALG